MNLKLYVYLEIYVNVESWVNLEIHVNIELYVNFEIYINFEIYVNLEFNKKCIIMFCINVGLFLTLVRILNQTCLLINT